VDPNRRTMPCGCPEGCIPRCGQRCGVEHAIQGSYRLAGAAVSLCQGDAAAKVVLPGRRPTGGIDPLQRGDEPSQVGRRLAWISEALDRHVLACEPRRDRPRPRVSLAGPPPSPVGPGRPAAGAGPVSAATRVLCPPAA